MSHVRLESEPRFQGMLGKHSELVRGMGILLISFFLEILIFMCMGFACVYAFASHVFLVPTGQKRVSDALEL